MAAKTFVKKKANENVTEELLNSLREKDEDEDKETKINTVKNLTILLCGNNKTQHKHESHNIYTNKEKF